MKKSILFTIICSLFISCAQTKINPESNKAVYWPNNENIVSNQKIHKVSFWTRQYKAEEVFPDNIKAQEKINEANKFRRYEAYTIWTMIASTIYYSNNNSDNFRAQKNNTNLIFLAGIVPSIYFLNEGQKKADEAVNHYNKEMGFSVYPIFQRVDQKNQASLVFSTSF
jgi:hypothetical protein